MTRTSNVRSLGHIGGWDCFFAIAMTHACHCEEERRSNRCDQGCQRTRLDI
ncbi:hypothetical protein [Anabaena sp. CCY 9910]|uniref:hypothetical protein n=1 Tax=Anabaena sp. CCY 9910 TaxID=3103870 RepID=UPI0039DFFB81